MISCVYQRQNVILLQKMKLYNINRSLCKEIMYISQFWWYSWYFSKSHIVKHCPVLNEVEYESTLWLHVYKVVCSQL